MPAVADERADVLTGELAERIDAERVTNGANSWTYHSRLSMDRRYLCMTVPKVACTTVKRVLLEFEQRPVPADWGQIHNEALDATLASVGTDQAVEILTSPDWLRFCFVRDPYDRMFSAWKSKIGNTWDTQYAPLRDRIREARHYPEPQGGRLPMVSFRDFVDYVTGSDDPGVTRDGHWDLQTNVLLWDLIDYDVVGRFETFQQDFVAVLERLDAPQPVLTTARQVTNSTTQLPLAGAYDRELADRVFTYYEADFDAFGYARDGWLFHGTEGTDRAGGSHVQSPSSSSA